MSGFVKRITNFFKRSKNRINAIMTEPSYENIEYNVDLLSYTSNLSIHEMAVIVGDFCNSKDTHINIKRLCIRDLLPNVKKYLNKTITMNELEVDSVTVILNALLLVEMIDDLYMLLLLCPNGFLLEYCKHSNRIYSMLEYLQNEEHDKLFSLILKWVDGHDYALWKRKQVESFVIDMV